MTEYKFLIHPDSLKIPLNQTFVKQFLVSTSPPSFQNFTVLALICFLLRFIQSLETDSGLLHEAYEVSEGP